MNKLYKFKNGKRIVALSKKICPVCKQKFQPNVSKRIYCTKECYYKMKVIRKDRVSWTDKMRRTLSKKYTGEGNPMFGVVGYYAGKKRPEITGERHPNYKGGWIQQGYHCIMVDGRKVNEQTYLMEKKLGRRLTGDEVVHHVDENKLNNNLDNLQLMTRAEHMAHHGISHSRKFIDSKHQLNT